MPEPWVAHGSSGGAPVCNDQFHPGADAGEAPAFSGALRIGQTPLQFRPELCAPIVGGRDARLFPGVTLAFFTLGDVLVPVERGRIVAGRPGDAASYWCVIPQPGRVWQDPGEGGWSRAAFPLMLVSDTENHAHQGLASFQYRDDKVSGLRLQFVQQTAPYLLRQHFIAWGAAPAVLEPLGQMDVEALRRDAAAELGRRLPASPWSVLESEVGADTLAGFGGPLPGKWLVQAALLRGGTLYYQEVPTPCGPYPYPLEMRFGVRSVMKSIAAPLTLLRLAQVYGPYVLGLRIGDYVPGLHPKYARVRFLDAANMASGLGGAGSWQTHPNDIMDGYLDADYDSWYTAPSHAEKLRWIRSNTHPYPWEPGTVVRYRDQDHYLLGAALDAFLKASRGPGADVWRMLQDEVFAPIGIAHAPAVRTMERTSVPGLVWFNAGYYPTIDDLAKIALLYQSGGEHGGLALLHPRMTRDLLDAWDALEKSGDRSLRRPAAAGETGSGGLYKMGFHFTPYTDLAGRRRHLPTMWGSGENEVVLYPGGPVSFRMAKAAELPDGERVGSPQEPATIRAVERLAPFL